MSATPIENSPSPSLVVIGNFDGVHRGHRTVLAAAVREAEKQGLLPLVLTFAPHPAEVLGKKTLQVLTSLPRKLAFLHALSPALRVVVEPFTRELSLLTPEEFVQQVLLDRLGAQEVVVGENFRFGRGRAGDLATLTELGSRLGFVARAEPLLVDEQGSLSSTRIRQALVEGDVVTARRLLGRPHAVVGRVVHGDHRGRTLGFPTANLEGWVEMLPQDGVYAGIAYWGERRLGPAVINSGARPTAERPHALEVHILDFDEDLYGQELTVEFVERLRDTKRFESLAALTEQIGKDVATGRACLAAYEAAAP